MIRSHSVEMSSLALFLLILLAGLQTSAAEVEYVPNTAEISDIYSIVDESLKEEAWNSTIKTIESFADVAEDGYRVDVVEIIYEPYYNTPSIRHGYKVSCTREVRLDGVWDCWSERYRYIRTSARDEWIYLQSHDQPLIDEQDAIDFAAMLYSLDKLYWAEYNTDILISDLGQLNLGLSYDGKSYSLLSKHAKWGAIAIQIERGPFTEGLVVEEVSRFFTVCDDETLRYGPNPCEAEHKPSE